MKKILFILFLVYSTLQAQERAFPTALGGGAFVFDNTVTYSVYKVTNCNGSGSGSFWNGIASNRIIIFDCHCDSIDLDVFGSIVVSNLIILGQTTPGGQTIITGQRLRFQSSFNIIIRYISFRQSGTGNDALEFIDSDNVILDHVSASFGGDETLSFRGDTDNITVQKSIFSYSKTGSLMGDSDNYTISSNLSFLSNLFKSVSHRTPNPNLNGRIDVIGNVYYNWFNRLMRTGGDVQLNEIGNFYKKGQAVGNYNQLDEAPTPSIFTDNNRLTGVLTSDGQDNWVIWQQWQGDSSNVPANTFYQTSTMHSLLNYTEPLPNGDDSYTALVTNREVGNNAYLSSSGNIVLGLDSFDNEAIDDIENDVHESWSSANNWSAFSARTSYLSTITSGNILGTRTGDSDNDGMADSWETANGLNVGVDDALGNDLSTVYPNILMYSFEVDGNVTVTPVTGVTLAPINPTAAIGNTIQFTRAIIPSNATNTSGTFSTSNATVATIDINGLVTPLAEGTATINYVTADGNFSDPQTLQVNASVTLSGNRILISRVINLILD